MTTRQTHATQNTSSFANIPGDDSYKSSPPSLMTKGENKSIRIRKSRKNSPTQSPSPLKGSEPKQGLNLVFQESHEQKETKGTRHLSNQRTQNILPEENPKEEELYTPHKDVQEIIQHVKDPVKLKEAFLQYKPKNQDFDIEELANSPDSIVKCYKDCAYFGKTRDNKREGKGIMIYAENRIYEGEWQNDLKHGKGTELLANGNKYEGNFEDGKPQGKGKFAWTSGEKYDGDWSNGQKHGQGQWRGAKGEVYSGEWKNGKADGSGVHEWRNGDRYEGEFKDFLKHGKGYENFSNGDFYVGNYQTGKPNGYGEYLWVNGSSYKGYFKNGLRHGKGAWFKGGATSDSYEGDWQNDKKNGKGVYTWASGNRYEGEYQNDLRHGYGEMYWQNGCYYKGQWEKGSQHGEGELLLPNGDIQKGKFANNEFLDEDDGEQELESESKVIAPSPKLSGGGIGAGKSKKPSNLPKINNMEKAEKVSLPEIKTNRAGARARGREQLTKPLPNLNRSPNRGDSPSKNSSSYMENEVADRNTRLVNLKDVSSMVKELNSKKTESQSPLMKRTESIKVAMSPEVSRHLKAKSDIAGKPKISKSEAMLKPMFGRGKL